MATKRRKNFLGFGGRKSRPSNYIPASGGIAYHSGKRKPTKSAASSSVLDDIARGMGGKSYKSLSSANQATVRKLAERMSNPKRKRNAELSLPKNKFIAAKVRMKGGKLQVMVDEHLLGHASAGGSVSLNPRRKRTTARRKKSNARRKR